MIQKNIVIRYLAVGIAAVVVVLVVLAYMYGYFEPAATGAS